MKKEIPITIVTPTYNRRMLLQRLFKSLLEQDLSNVCFEWLVVDDGSTDGTLDWLRDLSLTSPFKIRTFSQENGGKHRALNLGVRNVDTPWVMVVDSDDWLLPGAMARLRRVIDEVDHHVKAVIAPRSFDNAPGPDFRSSGRLASFPEWYSQSGVGDTSILMRTDVFAGCPFPEFPGEKFVPESAVYARAFAEGGILFSSDRFVGAEYQPDGLSAKSRQLRMQNPMGACAAYDAHLSCNTSGETRLRDKINYHRFAWHAKKQAKAVRLPRNLRDAPLVAAGWLLHLHDCWTVQRAS